MKTVLFDIDGTLSDHTPRLHYAEKQDWDSYHAHMEEDQPVAKVLVLAKELASRYNLAVATARPERYEAETRRWLERYEVPWRFLDMRPEGDWTPNWQIKRGALNRFRDLGCKVILAFDDNPDVIKMYMENDVPAIFCFQMQGTDNKELIHVTR